MRSHSVIYGIGLETEMEELTNVLNEQNEIKVKKSIRLNKGKEKIPSYSVKLVFDKVKELPQYLYTYGQRYPVKKFNETVLQCYKCQNFGHSSRNCGGKERCVVCSGNHRLSDCPKDKVKCANCAAEHASSFSGCPKVQEAVKINKIRVDNKLTFSEATKVYKEQKKTNPDRPETTAIRKEMTSTASQTDTDPTPITEQNEEFSTPNEKLCTFILECFKALIPEIENNTECHEKIVNRISEKVYGKEIYKLKNPSTSGSAQKHKLILETSIETSENSSEEMSNYKKKKKKRQQ